VNPEDLKPCTGEEGLRLWPGEKIWSCALAKGYGFHAGASGYGPLSARRANRRAILKLAIFAGCALGTSFRILEVSANGCAAPIG
jgi:hypothetical protein